MNEFDNLRKNSFSREYAICELPLLKSKNLLEDGTLAIGGTKNVLASLWTMTSRLLQSAHETERMPSSARPCCRRLSDPENFSRIHNVVGVDRLLDRTHNANSIAVLGNQKVYLAATDTVLAGAGAVQ